MDIRDVALLLTAVGATAIGPKMVTALWRALTGRATRQRREIDRVRAEAGESNKRAAAADARADDEAYMRRVTQEHASHLRRLLFEAPCVDPATIPPHPIYHRRRENT